MTRKPYPAELEERLDLRDGTHLTIRPIRPQDIEIERAFVRELSVESRYFRFLHTLRELDDATLIRLTDVDYDRELALIAVVDDNGRAVQVGVARYVLGKSGHDCEFAVAVADSWQGKGIGGRLMRGLMRAARNRGLETMEGFVLNGNQGMFALAHSLGFRAEIVAGDPSLRRVVRNLQQSVPDAAPDLNPGHV